MGKYLWENIDTLWENIDTLWENAQKRRKLEGKGK